MSHKRPVSGNKINTEQSQQNTTQASGNSKVGLNIFEKKTGKGRKLTELLSDVSAGDDNGISKQTTKKFSNKLTSMIAQSLKSKKTTEQERARRSMLIYGTSNMTDKQNEQEVYRKIKLQKVKEEIDGRKWKDRLFLHPEDRFLGFFDVFMLFVIGYSCFTSAYFLTFKMTTDYWLLRIEDATYCLFGLDLFFNFFRLYQNGDDEWVRNHRSIAKRYISRTFIPDVISTFPFYLLPDTELNLKLVRLFRLTRIYRIFNIVRFLKIGQVISRKWTRTQRVALKFTCKNIYSVFKMILIFIMITYFNACAFFYFSKYYNSAIDVADGNTFVQTYGFDKEEWLPYLLGMSYFVSTTVNIIGYGEMTPKSDNEKVWICFLMFTGQFMAVYFVGQFIEIITNSAGVQLTNQVDSEQLEVQLQGWLVLMKRFRDNKPIPMSLEQNIYDHFRHYWKEDRLPEIIKGGYLERIPRQLKRTLITQYMFDDLVQTFRGFFQPHRHSDGQDKLLEMMCFALSPRYYSPNNKDEYVIYDEGDEVLEIVFVLRGEVGVGFKLANSLVDKRFELTSIVGPSNYFADYYVLANVKSEFVYIASSEVHALGLSKRALTNKIFPFFRKSFYEEFSARAKARYIQFKDSIHKHKENRIKVHNSKNKYFKVDMHQIQPTEMKTSQVMNGLKAPEQILASKVQAITDDFQVVISDFGKFCISVDNEFLKINKKLGMVHNIMKVVTKNSDNWKNALISENEEDQRAAAKAGMDRKIQQRLDFIASKDDTEAKRRERNVKIAVQRGVKK